MARTVRLRVISIPSRVTIPPERTRRIVTSTRLTAPERAIYTGNKPVLANINNDIKRPMKALGARLCTQVMKKILI